MTKRITRPITLSRVTALARQDDYKGVCKACGNIADDIEPDARGYICEHCGSPSVYGAEEILLEMTALIR